jgi:hypothetical protein
MMTFLNRKQTIEILIKEFGDLKCSAEYYYREYDNTLSCAYTQDRHIQVGMFQDKTKSKDKFIGSNILFFEIDDLNLKKQPKNWVSFIDTHLNTINKAMDEFLKKPNHFKLIPVIGTFSGSKSIHFLFKIDRFLNAEEYNLIKKAFDIKARECLIDMKSKANIQNSKEPITHGKLVAMNIEGLKYPNLSLLDLNIPFNSSTSPRFHCDVPQDNRLAQKSVYYDNYTLLDSQLFLEEAKYIIKMDDIRKKQIPAIENQALLTPVKGNWYSKEMLEKILKNDLTPTSRQDKFLLRCPVHEDNNKSAFVTKSGFLYCSVCCIGGIKFAGRIYNNRLIVNPEITNTQE